MKTQADQPPRLAGIQAGPALAGVLYLLLVGSAVLALWVRQVPGALPPYLEVAAPWVFLVFAGCFAVYRFALVRARKYPAFKALFQIAAAAIFFLLLLPGSRRTYQDPDRDALMELMRDQSAEVRAVAAEVARHRPQAAKYGPSLVRALEDPDPIVREQAHRSLVAISGSDLGPAEDPGARKAWGEKFR